MFTNSQLLLQSFPEAVFMLDHEGFIIDVNPATKKITHYNQEELMHQHLSIFYGRDQIKAGYELEQAKKGTWRSESWRTGRDGFRFWGEITLTPINGEDGNLTGFCCMLRDVSLQKEEALSLQHQAEQYRLMVEGVRDYAIFMLGPEGHIRTWNEGARLFKGYNADEIIGKHFSIFYTAEDLQARKPENELKIARATGKYEEEGWRVRKNGSVFWANVVITALFNDRNELIGFSKVTRDLSERRENEENLRQSEERYRALVEQVTDYGIFMLDEKGRVISWNEGARKMKGYTAAEIIGKYFSIFYPEEEIRNGKPAYELKIARSVGKYEEEGWRLRKDGSRFWANVVITAIYSKTGSMLGFSKVTRDLTERKVAERTLRESYERSRTLAEELKATNMELSRANQELEQFTSIVSHDLQEPVRTIKSFLQLIDMKLEKQQYEDLKIYITKSIGAANRMRELIKNLLHYSQLGKMEIQEEEVSVKALVHEVLQNLKSAIDASGATISVEQEVETIQGDRVQLVQLIQNLLSNALKFTNREHPEITIKCQLINGMVRFCVSDNGIGIHGNDLGKVFEIFRRLNTEKEYPGTGIGLAICKKIVDRHRGRIWPESEPGQGTSFYFTLNENISERMATS